MFETSQDILNFSLAVGGILVAVLLAVALFQAIFVLRDVNELTKVLKKTARKANDVIVQPAKFLTFLFSKARTITELVEKQVEKRTRKK